MRDMTLSLDDLEPLVPTPAAPPEMVARWAVVTQTSPLRVRFDGDAAAMPGTPISLEPGVGVGVRVLCLLIGAQLVVMGSPGGGHPTGTMEAFAGGTPPPGWLACDGALVARAAYPGLFAVIGTTYGAGDGATTFRVPDARGRMLVGRDPSQPEFSTLGKIGGAKAVALTVEQMPSHSHTVYGRVDRYQGAGTVFREPTDAQFATNSTSTAASGGGAAHENLPPYLVSNWIIKT